MRTPARLVAVRAAMIAATALLFVGLIAGSATAKGADQATITGPGLATAIVLGGDGEPGSSEDLGQLSEGSGLFTAMFGPDGGLGQALTPNPPAGDLGPRYQIAYRVPGGDPQPDIVRQDLYPLAPKGPVTHTAAGQKVYGGATSSGGWYQATASFTALLKQLGVPVGPASAGATPRSVASTPVSAADADASADAGGGSGADAGPPTPWGLIGGLTAVALIVLAVVGLVARRRATRRRQATAN